MVFHAIHYILLSPAGEDYTAVSTTITFQIGESEAQVSISTTEDTTAELPESFEAVLSDPTGGLTIGAQSIATINIIDNEGRKHLYS